MTSFLGEDWDEFDFVVLFACWVVWRWGVLSFKTFRTLGSVHPHLREVSRGLVVCFRETSMCL